MSGYAGSIYTQEQSRLPEPASSMPIKLQQQVAMSTRVQQQNAIHKRSLSVLFDDQSSALSEADCIKFFEEFASPEDGPQVLEDFHAYLAREGCIQHPCVNPDLPGSHEDFAAYLARCNGINDHTTITKLRQALGGPLKQQQPAQAGFSFTSASHW